MKRMATTQLSSFTALDFCDRKKPHYPITPISGQTSIGPFSTVYFSIFSICLSTRMPPFKKQQNYKGVRGISEGDGTMLYLDFVAGYLTVHFHQNLLNCALKSTNFTICKYLTLFLKLRKQKKYHQSCPFAFQRPCYNEEKNAFQLSFKTSKSVILLKFCF